MSQTVETPIEFNPTTVIPVNTPAYQVIGGHIYKLNIETTAAQVKMSDGINMETRVNTIERALAGIRVSIVADTIADRDALVGNGINAGDRVYVLDASDDETVEKGGADYLYMTDNTWLKLSEWESMDVVCDWDYIKNKPESTPEQIDLSVAKQHTHNNIETLAALSEDSEKNLLFKGNRINDGKVWIARVESLADIPPNLADNGLVFLVNGAATELPDQAGSQEGNE